MTSTKRQPQRKPPRIKARDFVHDALANGPRFSDPVWDFTALARQAQAERRIAINSVPIGYRENVRVLLLALGRPSHPAIVAAGIVRRSKASPLSQLMLVYSRARVAAEWGVSHGLDGWGDWRESDLRKFVDAMRAGTHRSDGRALNPSSIRGYITVFKLMHEMADVLADPLFFVPFPHVTAMKAANEVHHPENLTKPLPWETWAPLMRAVWTIVGTFSVDIIKAHQAAESARTASRLSRGPSGYQGLAVLREYFVSGGLLPLATGLGRASHQTRGSVARSMLVRKAGISKNVITPAHESFRAEAQELLQEMLAVGRTEYGGLIKPSALVQHADGTTEPWVSEIGLEESEYLDCVLRGACYVLIAALSGMRDSELQAMQRGSIEEEDGLTVIQSRQYKGEREGGGRQRSWWAPTPVIQAVLALEAITPHQHIFTRTRRSDRVLRERAGAYFPSRDIQRLIEFVNGEPAQRCGRGAGLGLERINIPAGMAINQTSLRRSYSVYVVTHPEAEMGLGQQLGHWALRTTSAYGSDGMQKAVQMLDEQRREMVKAQVVSLVQDTAAPIAGGPADSLLDIRAQIIANPDRAAALEQDVVDRYHLGLTNDCFFRPATAACGTDGPHLASHFCASDRCANAVYHQAHIPVMERQVDRIDSRLGDGPLHRAFIEDLIYDRALLVQHLRTLNTKEEA